MDAYADYTDCIAVSLVEKKVDINRLKAYVQRLHAGCDEHNLRPVSSKAEGAFEGIDNIYGIIERLCNFTSFLDCHFFEKIVKRFKLDETQEDMMYPEKLREYIRKHTVSEFMLVHPILNDPRYIDDMKELVVIIDVKQISCQMREVIDIGQAVAHIMNLDQSQLLIHNIGGGSVTITFMIQISVANSIFSGCKKFIFSQEQIEEFQNISMMKLNCNGYEFDFTSPAGKRMSGCLIKTMCGL